MNRAAQIRAIHAAARRLALDEETRRAIYRRVAGRESLTEMSDAEVAAVAAEMRRLAPLKAPLAAKTPGRLRAASPKAHVRKVYALWWRLAEAGLVAEGARTSAERRKALNAFLNTRFKTELNGLSTEAEFLSAALAAKAAEALKAMAERGGLKLQGGRR